MANGWTLERRAKQAALIQTWQPWERSTGPKTEAGKATSSQNAFVHGAYSVEEKAEKKGVNDFLRDCKRLLQSIGQ